METRINSVAIRIALYFTAKEEMPERFTKKNKDLFQEEKRETNADKRFKNKIEEWDDIIHQILMFEDSDLVWRLFSMAPKMEGNITSVSRCQDFIELTDLFIRIRENVKSSPELIGRYSELLYAFQMEIEKQIKLRIK